MFSEVNDLQLLDENVANILKRENISSPIYVACDAMY